MASPTRTDKSQFHPYFSSFIPEFLQPKRSSRIEELLPSNKPPLEFEMQGFLEIAARGPQTLDEFDQKIAAARQLLNFLVSERDQAASNISDAKSVLHPMRRLPDDVLRSIFRICTKSADQAFNREDLVILEPEIDIESVQPNQSPWTVSCVCRQWRTVAIHTGELWSFVEIDLDNRPEDEELAKNRVFRLGLSLLRSSGHDLSIRLYGEKSVPAVCPILQILLPTAPHWKRLSVFLPLASFKHFSVCKGYLNRLDTLYIGGVESEIDAFHIDAFQLTPSLRVVGTYSLAISRTPTPFCVSASGVTTFISGGPNIHTYRCLKRFSHVQKLILFCWAPVDEAAEPISLHGVTFLHLFHLPASDGDLSVANMYSHLILPSLRHLEITFFGSESPDEISFPVVTNPDSCPIKRLIVYFSHLSQEVCTQLGDKLFKFLRGTPELASLYVMTEHTKLPDRWLDSLVHISGPDAVAPRLRRLSMPSGRISAGDLGCLVGVIESRRRKDIDPSDSKYCALLEKVELGPEPVKFDDEELSERWSALLAGGLIVTHRKK